MNDDTTELLGFPIVSTDALPDESQDTHAVPSLGDLSWYDRLAGMTAEAHKALADMPRNCPSCGPRDPERIGLMMRAQRPLKITALVPDDPSAAQFFWWCSACGLRWFKPAPPAPVVDLFLRALRFVSPERTMQAGGTEAILLSALADLGNR